MKVTTTITKATPLKLYAKLQSASITFNITAFSRHAQQMKWFLLNHRFDGFIKGRKSTQAHTCQPNLFLFVFLCLCLWRRKPWRNNRWAYKAAHIFARISHMEWSRTLYIHTYYKFKDFNIYYEVIIYLLICVLGWTKYQPIEFIA